MVCQKNIFILSSLGPSEIGGPSQYLNEFIEVAKKKENLKITYIFFSKNNIKHHKFNVSHYPVITHLNLFGKLKQYLFFTFIVIFKSLSSLLRKEKISFLISNVTFITPILRLFTKNIIIRCPGLVTWERAYRKNETSLALEDWITTKKGVKDYIKMSFEKFVCSFSKYMIFPSKYLKNIYLKLGIGSAHKVIYTTSKYQNAKFRAVTKVQYDCIYVGRLIRHKRVEELINTCQKNDLHIAICGDGPELHRLKENYSNSKCVTFLGILNINQLRLALIKSRCLVSYSIYEGLPHTAVECLSLGIPVVLNDAGGNRELNSFHGVTITPRDDLNCLVERIKYYKNLPYIFRINRKAVYKFRNYFGEQNILLMLKLLNL